MSSWESLQKQSRAVLQLRQDLLTDRVADSYLFSGDAQADKILAAQNFAMALNCERDHGQDSFFESPLQQDQGCGQCLSCRKILELQHPDFFILNWNTQGLLLDIKEEDRVKQKEYRIDAVRWMMSQAILSPAEGRRKVFVIDGAEYLSTEASNALLKGLEESPRGTRWILLTSSINRVLPTIQSRCRKISFASTQLSTQINDLAETAQSDAALPISKLLAQELASDCAAAKKRSIENILEVVESFLSQKKKMNARQSVNEFLHFFAEAISHHLHLNPNITLAEQLNDVLDAQSFLARNVTPQLVLENVLIRLLLKASR